MGYMSRSAVAPAVDALDTGADPLAARRPRLWRELLLIALCYSVYSWIRNLVPTEHQQALAFGRDILRWEHYLGINFELSLNKLFVDSRWLGVSANYYYATLHFVIPIGVLVYLYLRRPDRYVTYRRLVFGTTLTALAGFWLLPLAPPRMLPGFVDTVVSFHTWGMYSGDSPVASVSNQYAAMPSLHTAWSLWCAIAIIDVARHRWVKILAACYPAATIFVIIGTANHYTLDAVGGVIALGIGYLLVLSVRWLVPRLGPVSRVFSQG